MCGSEGQRRRSRCLWALCSNFNDCIWKILFENETRGAVRWIVPVAHHTSVALIQGKSLGVEVEVSWEWNWDNTSYKDSHTRIKPLALTLASGHGRYVLIIIYCYFRASCLTPNKRRTKKVEQPNRALGKVTGQKASVRSASGPPASSFWPPTPGHFKWENGWPPLFFVSDPRADLGF